MLAEGRIVMSTGGWAFLWVCSAVQRAVSGDERYAVLYVIFSSLVPGHEH